MRNRVRNEGREDRGLLPETVPLRVNVRSLRGKTCVPLRCFEMSSKMQWPKLHTEREHGREGAGERSCSYTNSQNRTDETRVPRDVQCVLGSSPHSPSTEYTYTYLVRGGSLEIFPVWSIFVAHKPEGVKKTRMSGGNRHPAQLTSNLKQGKDEKDLSREAVYVLLPGLRMNSRIHGR